MTRQSPYAGSAYVSTNYNEVLIDQPGASVNQDASRPRKSEAEHQATADRLIANMLTALDARTAEIVGRRTA